ncbi:MAG: hypothetical protein L6Q60_03815 [Rhodocyclaceae bacterium]|nr:hypothetical protein [Rhodocyclaceae bacterium]
MKPSARKPQLPDPVTLIAVLMTMMTRFSCLGCPRLANRIRRNLTLLQHYAEDEMPPMLKQTAQRLEREWAQLHTAISDEPHIETTPDDTHDRLIQPASQSLH